MLACRSWLYNDGTFRLLTCVNKSDPCELAAAHVFLLCAHVHVDCQRPWPWDMNTSCLLSLSLANQTLSPIVARLLFSVIIKAQIFFFLLLLFFSGQGCAGNYKSIEAWPGLYNLCGIFVQSRFCARAASENGLGSAFWSGIGFFERSFFFPTNPNHFIFFTRNLAERECSICTSGL